MAKAKKNTPSILVTVSGGIVQTVTANVKTLIVVADYDKHSEETLSISMFGADVRNKLSKSVVISNEDDKKLFDFLIENNL